MRATFPSRRSRPGSGGSRAEVGFPIVRRSQRYEGLTPEGERVLEWARRILADVGGLDAELDAMRGGPLRAAPDRRDPDLAAVVVAADDAAAAATHPGITVAVHSLNSRQIERGLHDFELELGVTYLDSEPLTRRPHARALRGALCAAHRGDRPAREARQVTWAEAATLPLAS